MESCQRATSVNTPEFYKTSTTNPLEQVQYPSVKMNDSLFLQIENHTRECDTCREVKFSSRWGLEQRSDSCQSSATDFPEPTMLSPTPSMCNRPFLQREDPNRPRCDKCSINESTSARGPGRSYINRISVMILAFLVILSCIASALACAFLKQLIDRCNDLEAKLNSAQGTYIQGLHDTQEFCLPCSQLIQGPFEEDNVPLKNLTRKTVDGIALCCGKTPTQFSLILDLYVRQTQKEKCAQEILNSTNTQCTNCTGSAGRPIGTPVSAHLVAGLQEESAIGKRYQPIRNWRDDKVTTHISGLKLINDRLLVPESGLYFVYSQVGFEVHYNSNEEIESANQTLYHYLNRYNPIYPNGGNQTIVKGAATQCWEKIKDFGHYTSYAGATVRLNEGDQLYIIVSQLYISRDPKLTYVGAYRIYY